MIICLKPANIRELIALIRAVLRRHRAGPDLNRSSIVISRFEGWHLDTAKRELRSPNHTLVDLTSAEFEMLHVFVCAAGQTLSRGSLMQQTKRRESQALSIARLISVYRVCARH